LVSVFIFKEGERMNKIRGQDQGDMIKETGPRRQDQGDRIKETGRRREGNGD